jgi:glutaredoxin
MVSNSMNFTVYSKLGCNYCEKIISVLQLAELNFVEYKLDEDFDKKEFYSQFGEGSTFPQVTVDAYTIGSAADTVKYLQEYNLV